jgi:1-acyl-sn-glycerol-3-phosphate acyltransferase
VSLLVRSILFIGLFHFNLAGHLIIALPALAMQRRAIMAVARSFSRTSLWLLRVVCGVKVEWVGLERVPPGRLIVAAKHQSTWDLVALIGAFPDPTLLIKREAMGVALLGWCMRKAGMIPVGRGRQPAEHAALTGRVRKALDGGRQVIVFPEGARRLPHAEPAYRDFVAHLCAETGAPCLPVALNSGLVWRPRSFLRRPGTIRVEFLDVIPPGLTAQQLLERLQREIESATARLIATSASGA